MTKLILATLLFFLSLPTYACLGPTVDLSLARVPNAEPTIYVNGSLRIHTGDHQVDVVDVYTPKKEAFSGLAITTDITEEKDTRNAFLRWAFPREPKPPQYYIVISIGPGAKEQIQGKELTKILFSLRDKGRFIQGGFYVNPELSLNCRPL